MNNITIVGNLGADPELSYTTGGKAKVKFTIADTRVNGENKETTWHRCVAWGEQAEFVAASLAKGQRCIIIGRYKTDSYTTKAGDKKETMEVLVDECGPSIRFKGLDGQTAPSNKPAAKVPHSYDEEEPF